MLTSQMLANEKAQSVYDKRSKKWTAASRAEFYRAYLVRQYRQRGREAMDPELKQINEARRKAKYMATKALFQARMKSDPAWYQQIQERRAAAFQIYYAKKTKEPGWMKEQNRKRNANYHKNKKGPPRVCD